MKVLHVTPAFYPQVGGIELVVQNLAVHSKRLGVDAEVLHVATEIKELSTLTVDGVKVTKVPLRGHRLIGYAPQMRQALEGFDLLHVHDPQLMAISANVMLSGSALPRVLSTHGGFNHTHRLEGFKRLHERFALSRMLAPYRMVLATSQTDATYFGKFVTPADRLRVTGNGIDVARYRVSDRAAEGDVHRWIYWGRLSANKRVDCLIASVERLRAADHRVDLLIAGTDVDGLAAGYQARIDAAGLGDSVRIAPPLSDTDLKAELRQRTVFITGSEYEGFGLTLLEAMAAGLLVVCRDVEPMNGFVQSGVNGLCLDFDGSDADLARLADFVSMDAARQQAMRAASIAFADTYDWPRIAERFIGAYREGVGEGSGKASA